MEPMQLRTHTSLWRVEKRLYKIHDITLPVPVSIRQIGIVLAVGVPWIVVMRLLRVPFAPPFGHLVWIAPPVLVAWWAGKPVAEGKRLGELLASQLRYLTQARHYAGLRPMRIGQTVLVRSEVWQPGAAHPWAPPKDELETFTVIPPPRTPTP